MTALRVAVVGTGFIAGRHLAALSGCQDVQVVAVADPVQERAQQAAQTCGARAYGDGLELLAQEQLDAVWLCVPPFAHGPLELAAVERGLPFFVEKPLAVDLETAVEVAKAVRGRGLLTGVGYHWRHLDVLQQAAAALDGRAVQLVTGSWLDRTPAAPWWARRERSGGQSVEQTTHLFDLVRVLAGEVRAVTSVERVVPRPHLPDADAPTASVTTLEFASGAIGTLASTCVLDWRHRVGLRLVAEGAVLDLTERSLTDHELRVTTAEGERVVRSAQDAVADGDQAFVAALRGGSASSVPPYAEALRTQALVLAADRSARDGVRVELPAVPGG